VKFLSIVVSLCAYLEPLARPPFLSLYRRPGDDSNPGIQTESCRSVQHAADAMRAGSTVNVARRSWMHCFSELSRRERPFSPRRISLPPADRAYLRLQQSYG